MLMERRSIPHSGEMAEWLKAHAWKACIGETLSRVRIPLSPQLQVIAIAYGKMTRFLITGGERGIRTLDRVSPIHAFQACAFNHSAISPGSEKSGSPPE